MNFDNLSEELKKQLLTAKELASNRLLRPNFFGNVVGVGIGEKVIDGVATGTACVRIYVQAKLDIDDVTPAYLLPSSFLDIPTDVIPVGRLGLAKVVGPRLETSNGTIRPGSPLRIRSKHSNVNSGAVGTLGAIVEDDQGKPYILCCNHILNVNGRVNKDEDAAIVAGDPVFGMDPPKITSPGKLFVPLKRNGKNLVDCALATVDNVLLNHPETLAPNLQTPVSRPDLQAEFPEEIGQVEPIVGVELSVDQSVRKAGAATGLTRGIVVDVNADFYVDYGFGTFLFTDQVVIDGKGLGNPSDIFATDGDSGSIVWDEEGKAVAMVFAEAGRFAVACKLWRVVEQIRLLPKEFEPPTKFKIVTTRPMVAGAIPGSLG